MISKVIASVMYTGVLIFMSSSSSKISVDSLVYDDSDDTTPLKRNGGAVERVNLRLSAISALINDVGEPVSTKTLTGFSLINILIWQLLPTSGWGADTMGASVTVLL